MQFYFARKASPENLLTVQTQKGQYLQLRLSFPLCLTFSHAQSVRPLNHKILNYGIFASTLKAYYKVLGGKQVCFAGTEATPCCNPNLCIKITNKSVVTKQWLLANSNLLSKYKRSYD